MMIRRLTVFGCGVITGMMAGLSLPCLIKMSQNSVEGQEKHAQTKEQQNQQTKDKIIDEAMQLSKTMKNEVGKLIKQVETINPALKKAKPSKSKSSPKN